MAAKMNHPDIEKQRALAEHYFPAEWAESKTMPGYKRRARQKQLRDGAVWKSLISPLRAAGKSCSNCRHWSRFHNDQMQCDIDSHFVTGSTITTADYICPQHALK